jgi:tetratricopeptide (TPR) repeat protein
VQPASDDEIAGYLERRGVHRDVIGQLLPRISGNWQVAHVLGDLAQGPDVDIEALPTGLAQGYVEVLRTALDRLGVERGAHLGNVLSVLAVSGPAPVLPVQLLLGATQRMGGPHTADQLNAVLLELRGHVVRGLPGGQEESVGLFHPTFVTHLRELPEDAVITVRTDAAHRALVDALRVLAPPSDHDKNAPLHRYAQMAEADHMWAIGDHEASFDSMVWRPALLPEQNVNRWRRWLDRLESEEGIAAVLGLRARRELVRSTAERGDFRNAVDLGRDLLRQAGRLLGPDDALTLHIEQDLAGNLAATGRFDESLILYRKLAQRWETHAGSAGDQALQCAWRAASLRAWVGDIDASLDELSTLVPRLFEQFGGNSLETLLARSALGLALALKARGEQATEEFAVVIPALENMLGAEHTETLWARCTAAFVDGMSGRVEQARRELESVLPLLQSAFGPAHPVSLIAEYYRVFAQGTAGAIRPAVEELEDVIPRLAGLLGDDHVHTLTARSVHAFLLGYSGNYARALNAYGPLIHRMEQVLGPDHWQTLICRSHMLLFEGRAQPNNGSVDELVRVVIPRLEEVLGRVHPQTLLARTSAAYLSAFTGDPGQALRAYDTVLEDQRRVLGPHNLQTLVADRNRVWLLLFSGAVLRALMHSRRVLPRLEHALGRDHLHTLVARDTHEFVRALLGGAQMAARRLPRIVASLEAQVGSDNPYTLVATAHLAIVLGWAGDIDESRATFAELLPRLQEILGEGHPQTLLANCNYAAMLVLHDRKHALRIYEQALPALERSLGIDHPLCLVHRNQEALLTLLTGKPLVAAYRWGDVGIASARRLLRQPAMTARRLGVVASGTRRTLGAAVPNVISQWQRGSAALSERNSATRRSPWRD